MDTDDSALSPGPWEKYGFIFTLVSGNVSAICSILIIYVISRSQEKLSSTYNRIMVGMSVSDVMGSIAMGLTTLPSPEVAPGEEGHELLAYPGAPRLGNEHTCKAQGVLISFGVVANYGFNVALCAYYACAIAFRMKEVTIRKYVEPFFYIYPVGVGVFLALAPFMKIRNRTGMRCIPYPAGCTGDEDCNETAQKIYDGAYGRVFLVNVILVVVFLGLVFVRVAFVNVQLKKRRSELESHPNYTEVVETHHNTKVVTIQALAYILAFVFTSSVTILDNVDIVNQNLSNILNAIFAPSQGVFNFIIFIGHKVYSHKRINRTTPVCELLRDLFCTAPSDSVYFSGVSMVEFDALDGLKRKCHLGGMLDDDEDPSNNVKSEDLGNSKTSNDQDLNGFAPSGIVSCWSTSKYDSQESGPSSAKSFGPPSKKNLVKWEKKETIECPNKLWPFDKTPSHDAMDDIDEEHDIEVSSS